MIVGLYLEEIRISLLLNVKLSTTNFYIFCKIWWVLEKKRPNFLAFYGRSWRETNIFFGGLMGVEERNLKAYSLWHSQIVDKIWIFVSLL